MVYNKIMEFIETPVFTKFITETMDDESYKDFQNELIKNPEKGDLIQGGGGVRKIRWKLENRGKSGSIRVIYYYKVVKEQIFLIYGYTKGKIENITEEQKRLFSNIAKELKNG